MELRRLIWQIAVVGKYISAKIHESNRKLAGLKNVYGEDQLALDRISDDILKNMLRNSGFVREYASEELKDIVTIGQGQEKYIVTADPVDGSSLVDTNLAIGTIIGIHKNSIFDSGRNSMVAALYITYGPLITMIYSAGKGVHEFVLDREGEYVLSEENIRLKEKGSIFSPGGLRRDWTDKTMGIAVNPSFVDGGYMTVPYFRFYTPGREWRVENEGVAPDIDVELDPLAVNRGTDSQLEAAIAEVMAQLAAYRPVRVEPPPLPTEPGR